MIACLKSSVGQHLLQQLFTFGHMPFGCAHADTCHGSDLLMRISFYQEKIDDHPGSRRQALQQCQQVFILQGLVPLVPGNMLRQLRCDGDIRVGPLAPEMLRYSIRHNFAQPAFEAALECVLCNMLKSFQEAVVQDMEGRIPVAGIAPHGVHHGACKAPVQLFLGGTVIPPAAFQQNRKVAFMTGIISMPGYVQ